MSATYATTTFPVTVASYDSYRGAEAAVDRLSDAGFPVERTSILGRGLSTVETVTGRMTKGRATLAGVASGVWFGLFAGLLVGLFAPGAWFGVVLVGLVLGAVWGAVFGFLGQAMTRGRRDFSSVQSLTAERYDVAVEPEWAPEAGRLLSAA